jgi:hypothetical protein
VRLGRPARYPIYDIRCGIRRSLVKRKLNQMSLSSAKNYALRAAKSQDQKEATELLSKAILELTLAIEATDTKIKKINKSS